MFPFHQSDELLLQSSSNPHQKDIMPRDLILGGNNLANKMGKDLSRKTYSSLDNNKKIMRRDTERQRRQQMAILNESLRSLLPLDMIKGKRSVSDHMNEAANYIKYLKNNIQKLSIKRDELKTSTGNGIRSDNYQLNCVMVHPSWGGVEVVISSSCINEEGLLLSEVLEILLEEGLSVVSCVSSTRGNEGLFYSIQSKVNDLACLDLSGIQRKLNDLILSSRYK